MSEHDEQAAPLDLRPLTLTAPLYAWWEASIYPPEWWPSLLVPVLALAVDTGRDPAAFYATVIDRRGQPRLLRTDMPGLHLGTKP